jgi:putative FmdB family regulatory protein
MPTYEYRCAKCGQHVEVYQSFSEAPLTKHEKCGGKLTKVLSPAGIVLKGSGFYKTDSRGSGSSSSPKKSDSKSETNSETKPETKSDSKSESTSSSSSSGEAKTA